MLRQINQFIREAPKGRVGDWRLRPLDAEHLAILEKECTQPSEFDEILSKQQLFKQYKDGKIEPYVCEHKITKDIVVALFPETILVQDVPWALWSQIVQCYRRANRQPHTIFLLAHPALREFPPYGKHVTPRHINGGYTYPCNADCVFVFRAEDATRVLIHELFHSACSDNTQLTLEEREAETEAWAELFWCALVARGDLKVFKSYVSTQGDWMRTQNAALIHGHLMQPGFEGFPWRYTLGKALLWRRWGLLEGCRPYAPIHGSLRLTFMPPAELKRSWNVPVTSTML